MVNGPVSFGKYIDFLVDFISNNINLILTATDSSTIRDAPFDIMYSAVSLLIFGHPRRKSMEFWISCRPYPPTIYPPTISGPGRLLTHVDASNGTFPIRKPARTETFRQPINKSHHSPRRMGTIRSSQATLCVGFVILSAYCSKDPCISTFHKQPGSIPYLSTVVFLIAPSDKPRPRRLLARDANTQLHLRQRLTHAAIICRIRH